MKLDPMISLADRERWLTLLAQAERSPERYFAENAKSFAFAARLFPPEPRRQVAQVYAFCRATDDLADGGVTADRASAARLLDAWLASAARSYAGEASGIRFLDEAMAASAEAGVPFDLIADLVTGVRQDLEPVAIETWSELHLYCYRVAGAIGIWLTRLFGLKDPWLLDRAEALGHGMQLTNILRDVGEDLALGRVYLPREQLERYGLGAGDLRAMRDGAPIGPAYARLVEDLMARADRHYALAREAMPRLPGFYARPVAVAAEVYRGIHADIRRRGYDNLRQRACTGGPAKLRLAARGLWQLYVPAAAPRPTEEGWNDALSG